jgi:very-short-patch-repair endonuclease
METGAKVMDNSGAGVAFATPSQHPGVRSTERMTTPPDRTPHWADYDLTRKQIADVRDCARSLFNADICVIAAVLDRTKFESPIEAVFLMWFEFLFLYAGQLRDHAFVARAQHTVTVDGERFRPDFVIVPGDPLMAALGEAVGCEMKIAVELDGHDFHERTKEQVAYRNRRDRVLQRHGWTVLHISGSELVRTQVEALREVWLCATSQMTKLREAVAKEWGAPLKYPKAE